MEGVVNLVFFARVKDRRLLELLEFYSEDIKLLGELGFKVRVETTFRGLARSRGEICYAWWWASALPAVLMFRVMGRPIIVTGATDYPDPGVWFRKRQAKRVLTSVSARLATGNVAISDYELELLRPLRPHRVVRIYPAVDCEYFCPGRKSDHPKGITIGQLNDASMRRKGIDVAIRATELIRRHVPEYRLMVVGPLTDDGRRYLDALREEVDWTGVDILGELPRDSKRDATSSAWLYLQPSVAEGFGAAVGEAMATGTAPICSAAGSLPEVVADCGIVVSDRTPQAFAEAAVGLLCDEKLRTALEVSARARAVEAFGSERRRDAMKYAFRLWGVCSGTGSGPCAG